MSFPLAQWIDDHSDVPHNLGVSGMRGELRSRERILRHPGPPDPRLLRRLIARLHRVPADRVFLTHGATEGTFVVLAFLARRVRGTSGRIPRLRVRHPEYPPIPDAAVEAGFRVSATAHSAAQVFAMSNPGNPEGRWVPAAEVTRRSEGCAHVVVDETFREFSGEPSLAAGTDDRIWVVGSLTKAYGADSERVGFVVASAIEAERFARFHGLVSDSVASHSVGAAIALLTHRDEVLGEARSIFRANEKLLRAEIPAAPPLGAPLWFDRGDGRTDGGTWARAALRAGVLVCPGAFFGVPNGVRVCLTRRTFPDDLAAYAAVRSKMIGRLRARA